MVTTGDLATNASLGPYDQDGPQSVSTFTVQVTGGPSQYSAVVYLTGKAGAQPVVVLAPGLQQPAAAYAPYGRRLASHGINMITRDDPGLLTGANDIAADLVYLVNTFLPQQQAAPTSMFGGHLDLGKLGLAGHSRGGFATLRAVETGLAGKAKAWFGLDPVDVDTQIGKPRARDGLAMIGIPTTFLGAGVTSNCAPAGDSYNLLYGLAPSPSVLLVAVGAGHTQLEDPASCSICGFCMPAGTADGATVLHFAVRYLTAFFARELSGDQSVGATFDGAGAPSDLAAGLIQRSSK
jgi:hypothetical protein